MTIRIPKRSDLPAISRILDETALFPPEILDEMIAPFFDDAEQPEKWFVCEDGEGGVVGFAYCRPEPLTVGTWNLLAIGVHPAHQGRKLGAALMRHTEQALAGERLLLVETSSLDSFARTRAFYIRCGYDLVATIPGYWEAGDDKVIFSKSLE
ncbi:MAG: GNAT family N-acetyltransferase [Bacteroidota bacterium]